MKNLYTTMTFNDIFPNVDSFVSNYLDSGIPAKIKSDSAKTLYYLLVARYGNNPIANNSIEQFKIKICSVIFQYGPSWERRLEIQDTLRGFSEQDLMLGATNIYNTALNPAEEPNMQTAEELAYINQQNVNKYKRSKLDAYGTLWDLLRTDVTESFLVQFKKLFKIFVTEEEPLLYSDEECEEE